MVKLGKYTLKSTGSPASKAYNKAGNVARTVNAAKSAAAKADKAARSSMATKAFNKAKRAATNSKAKWFK